MESPDTLVANIVSLPLTLFTPNLTFTDFIEVSDRPVAYSLYILYTKDYLSISGSYLPLTQAFNPQKIKSS